jgi:hypothetical protein
VRGDTLRAQLRTVFAGGREALRRHVPSVEPVRADRARADRWREMVEAAETWGGDVWTPDETETAEERAEAA